MDGVQITIACPNDRSILLCVETKAQVSSYLRGSMCARVETSAVLCFVSRRSLVAIITSYPPLIVDVIWILSQTHSQLLIHKS